MQPFLAASLYHHLLMARNQWTGEELADAELLSLFLTRQDDATFAALVHRHGPMVLGVCRRILRHAEDAEDAFQATFLLLARNGGLIRRQESLASWLHDVALRVARRARQAAEVRRRRERECVLPPAEPVEELLEHEELLLVLDEELNRLPESDRAAVVLCYLEGRTHEQAARELGWPAGSMWWRLRQALALLRERLSLRGLSLPAGAVGLIGAASKGMSMVPTRLLRTVLDGGFAFGPGLEAVPVEVSRGAITLAREVLRTMTMKKLKGILSLGIAVAVLSGATALTVAGHTPPTPVRTQSAPPLAVLAESVKDPEGAREPAKGPEAAAPKKAPTLLPGHARGAISAAFAPDGKTAATAGLDGVIRIWDVAGGKLAREVKVAQGGHRLGCVAFSGDGQALVGLGPEVLLTQWDTKEYREMTTFEGRHQHWGGPLALSPDGKLVASGGERTIGVWDRATGKQVTTFATPGHTGLVGGLAFAPGGKMLASSGQGGRVLLWDAATGKNLGSAACVAPWAVGFAPGGHAVVSAASEGEVVLTEVASGLVRRRLQAPKDAVVSQLAVADDGTQVAAGCQDGKIHLFDMTTGRLLRTLEGHRTIVEGLTFAPPGDKLISVARGETDVRLWDTPAQAGPPPRFGDRLWEDLAAGDASRAYDAVLALAANPAGTLPLLSRLGKAPDGPGDKKIARWIADLDDNSFEVREQAREELAKVLETAAPHLRKALENPPSVEVRRSIEVLLAQLEEVTVSPQILRELRVVEVLERIANPEARVLLTGLAKVSPQTRLSRAAQAALDRLKQLPGKDVPRAKP